MKTMANGGGARPKNIVKQLVPRLQEQTEEVDLQIRLKQIDIMKCTVFQKLTELNRLNKKKDLTERAWGS